MKTRARLDIDDFVLVEHLPDDWNEPFTIHSIPFAQSLQTIIKAKSCPARISDTEKDAEFTKNSQAKDGT
ncbi:hypothetical protein [Candidatus Protochlamydia naegleriophila]|uniref:hypothetical protein n=1 Tax=Candidatus Protochlamydia naegleriophila TaxID=389348 RepID=UPI00073EC81E|nr:hypothetical protein [Candidatus Protochlamydia naegleriophila]